jgi:hypothetical protein
LSKLPFRLGGLMRCCAQTLIEYQGEEKEGTVISCTWCSSKLVVRDGAWEWQREEEFS